LIPYQLPQAFQTAVPYVLLVVFIAVLLFIVRRITSLTDRLTGILQTRVNLSEGIADLLTALARFTIWLVAGISVVSATMVTFGLGQVIAESISRSLAENASRIVLVVLTMVVSYILVRLIHVFLAEYRMRTKLHPFTVNLLENLATYFIYAIAALLVLTNVLVAAGLGTIAGSLITLFTVLIGLVVSFAATGSIGNALAGLLLMSWRPYREGDRVEIGTGTYGDILEIDVMFTKVRTIKDEIVYVPNLQVLGNRIMNYNGLEACIVHQEVTIGYDVKRRTVEELLIRAAEKTEDLLNDPPPFVLVTNLDNYYVAYQINAYTNKQNRLIRIYSDLMKNILDVFDEANVEILSPQYAVLRLGKNIEQQS
jgi:small-conductance mechanosensitive channel